MIIKPFRKKKTKPGVQHRRNLPGSKLSKKVKKGMLGLTCSDHGVTGLAIINLQTQRQAAEIANRCNKSPNG